MFPQLSINIRGFLSLLEPKMSLCIHKKVYEGSMKLLCVCIKRNMSTRVLSMTWSSLTWSILNPEPGRMQGSFWQIPVPLRAVPPVTLPEVRGQGRPVALNRHMTANSPYHMRLNPDEQCCSFYVKLSE